MEWQTFGAMMSSLTEANGGDRRKEEKVNREWEQRMQRMASTEENLTFSRGSSGISHGLREDWPNYGISRDETKQSRSSRWLRCRSPTKGEKKYVGGGEHEGREETNWVREKDQELEHTWVLKNFIKQFVVLSSATEPENIFFILQIFKWIFDIALFQESATKSQYTEIQLLRFFIENTTKKLFSFVALCLINATNGAL